MAAANVRSSNGNMFKALVLLHWFPHC
jgi:hypothetical protein